MPGHDLELAPQPGLTSAAESALENLARETTLGDAPAGCDSPYCEGGMTDSGGVTQWDTPIMMPCPECGDAPDFGVGS